MLTSVDITPPGERPNKNDCDVATLALPLPLPTNPQVDAGCWPRPLSPLAGDAARQIELERALRAESAMSSVAGFTTQDIVHEDEWLIVINKPPGIYAGHVLNTVKAIVSSRSNTEDAGHPPTLDPHLHLANRLDRDTSGLIIVTKCKIAAGRLSQMFEKRRVKKTYVALCCGARPLWDEILVTSGHGRSRWGAWRIYAHEDIGRRLPEKATVKDMTTCYKIVAVNGQKIPTCNLLKDKCQRVVVNCEHVYSSVPASGDEVLLRAYPLTGRTHQVRLHCQFLGLPLIGDIKYGGPLVWKGKTYNTHSLHAESMQFKHPITDADMFLSAPLPAWAVL